MFGLLKIVVCRLVIKQLKIVWGMADTTESHFSENDQDI